MKKGQQVYNFALSWSEYKGRPFITWLKEECEYKKMSFLWCHDGNVSKIIGKLENKRIRIEFLWDMDATYTVPGDPYARLCYAVKDTGGKVVDEPDTTRLAIDKSISHYKLRDAGVPTPFTIIVRNWRPDTFRITKEEKKKLGFPFVIKPATGYGRVGVVMDANWRISDIAQARNFNRGDNFLLQEKIQPVKFDRKIGWFRVFYVFGEVIPLWWHPLLGEYEHVTLKEMVDFKLLPLVRISTKIAQATGMEWFSSEIAVYDRGEGKKFAVIDYVNDQCDVQIKSQVRYAPPDNVILHITERFVDIAWRLRNKKELQKGNTIWLG